MKLSRSVTLLALTGVGVLTWSGLDRVDSGPDWVRVDGPRYVESGRSLRLGVRVAKLKTSQFLTADLHWARTHDRSEGYLSTGGAQEVGGEGGDYDYIIHVPPRPGLRFVRAVVYLSRTGDWDTHTLVAGSDFIEVLTNSPSDSQMRVMPLRMTYERQPPGPHAAVSVAPRFLTSLLFLIAAAVGWKRSRAGTVNAEATGAQAKWWVKPVVAFTAAAVWELAGAEGWMDSFVRKVAHSEDWYYLRGGVQKVAISAIVAIVVLVSFRVLRGSARQQLVTGFLLLYFALSAINLVSLHSIDRLADLAWHGVTLIQTCKMGCAAVLTIAALGARPAKSRPT